MDKQAIFDFIKQNGGAEVPSLQLQFNISYKQARAVVSELVSSRCLEFYKGVTYVCVGKFANNSSSACADDKRLSHDESMEAFLRKAEERRRKRVQQIFQQQHQQQQRADKETVEKEVVNWLKEKVKSDSKFKLLDAKIQSEKELANAKLGNDQTAIQAQERIFNYLKDCSEFDFALLKLNAVA